MEWLAYGTFVNFSWCIGLCKFFIYMLSELASCMVCDSLAKCILRLVAVPSCRGWLRLYIMCHGTVLVLILVYSHLADKQKGLATLAMILLIYLL